MDWPLTLTEHDTLVVRYDTADGPRFVVRSCRGPQLTYRTYAEAEACALANAERANAHAWYRDGHSLQIMSKDSAGVPSWVGRGPT
jgi:hypothetical protein